MNRLAAQYLEVAFALTVTGAALTPWPWLALIVAGAYFVALAVVADRRTQPEEPPVDEPVE
jgi:hypothetical protein